MTRAFFLKSCTLAFAAAVIKTPSIFDLFTSKSAFSVTDADGAAFTKHLNERFTVRISPGRSVPVVLANVTELPASKHYEQFSLVFHGPAGARLPDDTYRFEHPSLGNFDVFIVAIGPVRPERTTYQACFSRPSRTRAA